MSKIVYEPHPVTPERKAELRAQGLKIIDARFAPPGHEPDKPARKLKGKAHAESAAEPAAPEPVATDTTE
ncbi:MAG: hypothetical protein KBE25_00640 [Laribacter sp.]|nr:hypothetical protein [Laribacter sp.]MBP9607850.1 hypothetical protein [Laribacter sp.]